MSAYLERVKNALRLIKSGKFDLFLCKLGRLLGFKNILASFPLQLIIEPANFCVLGCPICPTGTGRLNRPRRIMTLEEFKGIIDQIKGYTDEVAFIGYGEPFLNREVLRMTTYAVSSGIDVKIYTNAELLNDPALVDQIIKSGLKRLIISFDGLDQQTLEKYRRGANFQNVVSAFELIHLAKQKYSSALPTVELQFLLMKHNQHQLEDMKKFAAKVRVDVFSVKTLHLYGSEFQKEAEEFLTDSSLTRYKIEDGRPNLLGKMRNKCDRIYYSLVVNSDGDVVSCNYDIYSQFIMGNVFKEKVKDIWRGDKYQNFRKTLRHNRKSISICSVCPEGRGLVVKEKELV